MKKTAKELDHILEEWLEEHKQKRNSGNAESEHDFMGMMLSLLNDAAELPSYDADTINKATCLVSSYITFAPESHLFLFAFLAIILGGTDTTTVMITWALSLLLNHRDFLEKAQHELDTYVGRERPVQEADVKNLVYLQAIIKETTRLYPTAPLSVPHDLASLLQAFEITTPSDEPVDMGEGAGLTNLKATPLKVILTPRLPPHLYE
ncbi:hypothetical protein QUC31_000132 [Theobroma cacao]